MNVLLINARSLVPKMYSLVDTMKESNAQLALVTETWMRDNEATSNQLRDLYDGLGYGCIRQDRCTGVGGGVALVYDKNEISFHQLKTGCDFEIVAALGRRTGQRRKLIAISAYIPPGLDAESSDKIMQKICDLVGTYKRKYSSPYFVIGGDFNKRDIARELRIFPDIELVVTPPTRGKNHLDLIFTNFPQYIDSSGVTEPICNSAGTETDHLTVYFNSKIPRVPAYKVESYTYLEQSIEGDNKLCLFLNNYDWENAFNGSRTTDEMVSVLHRVFKNGMESSYERKSSVKRHLSRLG